MALVNKLFFPLLLTIVIEVAVAALLGYRKKTTVMAIIYINIVTNLSLNSLILADFVFSWQIINVYAVILLEIIIVVIEWRLLVFALHQKSRQMFYLSLAMNSASFIVGLILMPFIL
jgi:hypothetical protein